ncbi:MAG: hypothetical protein KF729_26885 [Sandaracinaceae bacterium]|nr:hypothetical protein [Sandaracinaceae bacterium]
MNLPVGIPYCYRGARLCATSELHRTHEDTWGGVCVDHAYCRWVLGQPELAHIRCRYSEGTLFDEGPPDEPCGTGSDPSWPFCGGQCGDRCPGTYHGPSFSPSCVGISESRGFGVCAPSRLRCSPVDPSLGLDPIQGLDECQAAGGVDCVCMLLSPVALPEYADHGWGVARRSCVAYRDRFPTEVRCLDRRGHEL